MIAMPLPDKAVLARRTEIVQALRRIVPGSSIRGKLARAGMPAGGSPGILSGSTQKLGKSRRCFGEERRDPVRAAKSFTWHRPRQDRQSGRRCPRWWAWRAMTAPLGQIGARVAIAWPRMCALPDPSPPVQLSARFPPMSFSS